jgi:hypothetical protein
MGRSGGIVGLQQGQHEGVGFRLNCYTLVAERLELG